MEESLLSNFFFRCYNRSSFFIFFLGMCHANSFLWYFFFVRGGGGKGLKLGLSVFHHNNNFKLINIYSTKTLMFCFVIFFTMLRVQIFLCPFGAP